MARSKDPKIEIVKVQLPLFGTMESLVYAKGRSRAQTIEVLPRNVRVALGANLKGYFRAIWLGPEKGWNIGERVEDKDW